MLEAFFPSQYAETIRDVDYPALYAVGIRGLAFDIDNTVEGYESPEPSPENAAFLRSLVDSGFSVCFVSNNSRERVERFNAGLRFPALHKAGKPGKKAVLMAAELMGVRVRETAFIGDQVFTDVWCGNRMGLHTILVKPVTARDPWNVALKRLPEGWIIKHHQKIIEKKRK